MALPRGFDDDAATARAAAAGVRVLPLSRYGHSTAKPGGLLLGFAALAERRIAAGWRRRSQKHSA